MKQGYKSSGNATKRHLQMGIGFFMDPTIVAQAMLSDFMLDKILNGWSSSNQVDSIIQTECSKESIKNGKVAHQIQLMSKN